MQQQVQVYMQQIGTFIKMYVSSQMLPIYLPVQIDAAFFPQERGRDGDFSFYELAITLLLIYQQENKLAKLGCVMYTSSWKQTAVYLCYSVCRSTCLLGKCSFLSFCECEKQDLSADRALFSISINRCQHMPRAGLANTSHRITFHQG